MKVTLKIRILLLVLTSSCFSQQTFAQAISFSPTRLFFKGNPGETVSEVVTVSNSGADSYAFIASIQDWKRDSLGTKIYYPMGTLPNSNAGQISLPSTSFQVNPGERKSFTVSMRIPKEQNSTVSSNSILFFTQTNAREPNMKGKAGIGIKVSLELGIQLFYAPASAKTGELNFLAFEQENNTAEQNQMGRLAVKFENTGEVSKDGFIRFELTNKKTGEEIKLNPVPIAIMPLDHQWVYCQLGNAISEGDYLAVAILDTGGNNDLKVAEKDIHVKK